MIAWELLLWGGILDYKEACKRHGQDMASLCLYLADGNARQFVKRGRRVK